jgi:integrase
MRNHGTRRGACVVKRTSGSTGVTTFSLKFIDADGAQAWERLGTDVDGWTDKKARAELEQRLVDVRREGLRRPADTTFRTVAQEWLDMYPTSKRLKRSTKDGYRTIVEKHLIPNLGTLRIDELDVHALDHYVARTLADGAEPGSVNRHLNVVSLIVKAARKRGLIRENPVELVDRPKERKRRWRILDPAEVQRVQVAFGELLDGETDEQARAWIRQARVVFMVVYGTGLRRSELRGLRWSRVRLADPAGPTIRVEETFVRNQPDIPKSDASERTVALGDVVADLLFEHRAATPYDGEDDRVFVSQTGHAIDPTKYARTFRAALKRANVTGYVRPFHDGRHGHITNAAAAGVPAHALQAQAGHADFSTTKRYIDLAGVSFRDEARLAEARLFGAPKEPNG